jgi:hypothetical protein
MLNPVAVPNSQQHAPRATRVAARPFILPATIGHSG